jgi:glycine hydroxymethyltransferase
MRVGTPAITTRGMGVDEMKLIVEFIDRVVNDVENEGTITQIKAEVKSLCESFPLYPELHN